MTAINLKDNKLADAALAPMIVSISTMPELLTLDLSMNRFERKSASMLAEYLALADCPLRHLTINNADIDDWECLVFVNALSKNTTLSTLVLGVR